MSERAIRIKMVRIKRGIQVKKTHKKLKKQVKGYLKSRRASVKRAREAMLKAGTHAYRDRRRKKRDKRRIWIVKINAGLTDSGMNYSQFIYVLKKKNIALNRKMLADLAEFEPKVFNEIVKKVKG